METAALTLDVGSISGIAVGAVFRSAADPALRVRISRVLGLSESQAKTDEGVTQPIGAVHSDDRFILSSWAVPASAPLRIWIPPSNFTESQMHNVAMNFRKLRAGLFHLVGEAAEEVPTRSVLWSGSRWELRGSRDPVNVTGKDGMPDVQRIQQLMTPEDRLLIFLPPPDNWSGATKQLPASLVISDSPESATYWLEGRMHDGAAEYAWIQPRLTAAVPEIGAMPRRTTWESLAGTKTRERLWESARKLGAVAAFLTLAESDGSDPFPYHLVLQRPGLPEPISGTRMRTAANAKSPSEKVLETATVYGGDRFDIVLKADRQAVEDNDVPERWVYVFALNSEGRRDLVFASSDAHVGRFPLGAPVPPPVKLPADRALTYCKAKVYPQTDPLDELCLGTVNVCPPYGADTLFELSTDRPIADLSIFSSSGVRGDADQSAESSTRGGNQGLLERLIEAAEQAQSPADGSAQSFSVRGDAAEHFSVERLTVVSIDGDVRKVMELCGTR